jgi:phospholipid transport system transporter-binding protein
VPAEVSLAGISALDANSFMVKGVLDFDTVPNLTKQAELMLRQSSDASVDFSEVEKTNSAGLALLLEIVRFMQLRNASVQFKNVPEQIAIVARAYGIDTALDSAEFARQAIA